MHPKHHGDTYEMAKLCILRWLVADEQWLIHPMYFPANGEEPDQAFPRRYADFLGVCLVRGDMHRRRDLVDAVAGDPGHLFLDPDTGLKLGNAKGPKHLNVNELVKIASSPSRTRKLVLVYDQSINFNHKKYGTPVEQVGGKIAPPP